jgi:hypothetical protein
MQPHATWYFPLKEKSKLNHVTIGECYFKMEGAERWYDEPLRHSISQQNKSGFKLSEL